MWLTSVVASIPEPTLKLPGGRFVGRKQLQYGDAVETYRQPSDSLGWTLPF
jgi:hypothetical protein